MRYITQSRFPRLWLLFQQTIGGTVDKQRLAVRAWKGEKRILEVGCSVGNVSDAFRRFPDIQFTGVDIDRVVLDVALSRFADCNGWRFLNVSLADLRNWGETFDYILFAGIFHHIDDAVVRTLLADVQRIILPHTKIVIYEPREPRSDDSFLIKLYYRLEEGRFLRQHIALRHLITESGLVIREEEEDVPIAASIFHLPQVSRFSYFVASRQNPL